VLRPVSLDGTALALVRLERANRRLGERAGLHRTEDGATGGLGVQ
jgi:hypothetical protein